jgi:hypothetical protein
MPPEARMISPVIQNDASEARKTATGAGRDDIDLSRSGSLPQNTNVFADRMNLNRAVETRIR